MWYQYLIEVFSYAFQITGAIILVRWSVNNIDKRIKANCLQGHMGLMLKPSQTGVALSLSKQELQEKAKEAYKAFTAALCILLGYGIAVIAERTGEKRCLILVQVLLCVGILRAISGLLINYYARKKYPNDILMEEEEISEGTTAFFPVED